MSEPERDYLAIIQADAERFNQAKWLALSELQPEVRKCWTVEDCERWRDRVEQLTREIMLRLN